MQEPRALNKTDHAGSIEGFGAVGDQLKPLLQQVWIHISLCVRNTVDLKNENNDAFNCISTNLR
jgi:hypothetical protein